MTSDTQKLLDYILSSEYELNKKKLVPFFGLHPFGGVDFQPQIFLKLSHEDCKFISDVYTFNSKLISPEVIPNEIDEIYFWVRNNLIRTKKSWFSKKFKPIRPTLSSDEAFFINVPCSFHYSPFKEAPSDFVSMIIWCCMKNVEEWCLENMYFVWDEKKKCFYISNTERSTYDMRYGCIELSLPKNESLAVWR